MSSEDENMDEKNKIINIILIIVALMALGWVNYLYFAKHISSNPERINNFIAIDNNVDKFRIPVSSVFFYPYNKQGKKILASQTNPRIFVVPYSGYLYSEQNVAKAYNWLLPWKDTIKNVVLIAQSKDKNFSTININKAGKLEINGKNMIVSKGLNEFLQKNSEVKFRVEDLSNIAGISQQLPLISQIFGSKINFAVLYYGANQTAQVEKLLRPLVQSKHNLLIFSADMSGHYTEGEQKEASSENIDLVVNLAQKAHLYPKIFDLVNFEDIAEQNYRLSELKNDKPLTTLEQEVESLTAFARLHGEELFNIAMESLSTAVLKKKQLKPERETTSDVLFNRGAVYINLYKDNALRGSSGSLLPSQAIAFAVAQNTYSAAVEDKDFPPLQPEELSKIKIKMSLLTGYEKISYQDEADLLKKMQIGRDGLVIRDGNRQGIFLPSEWKQYASPQEFLNNLKIKTGMSPAYWSNQIKVYRFKAVEISKDEN